MEPSNRRVLFVDDDERLLSAVKRQLRRSYEVTTATSGMEALEQMRQAGPFAVLVVDLQMPGMSGLELLVQARQQFPAAVRVMLTGKADLQAAMSAVNLGHVFGLLSKPCPQDEMCKTLEAALDAYAKATVERESAIAGGQAEEPYSWTEHDFQILQRLSGE